MDQSESTASVGKVKSKPSKHSKRSKKSESTESTKRFKSKSSKHSKKSNKSEITESIESTERLKTKSSKHSKRSNHRSRKSKQSVNFRTLPVEIPLKIFEDYLSDRLYLLRSVCGAWNLMIDSIIKRNNLIGDKQLVTKARSVIFMESESLKKLAPKYDVVLNKITKIQAIEQGIDLQLKDLKPLTNDIIYALAQKGKVELLNQIIPDWPLTENDSLILFEKMIFTCNDQIFDWCLINIDLFISNVFCKSLESKLHCIFSLNQHLSKTSFYPISSFMRLQNKFSTFFNDTTSFSKISIDYNQNFDFKGLIQLGAWAVETSTFYFNHRPPKDAPNDNYLTQFAKDRKLKEFQYYLEELNQLTDFTPLKKLIKATVTKTIFDYDWCEAIPLFDFKPIFIQRLTKDSLEVWKQMQSEWLSNEYLVFSIIFQQDDVELLEHRLKVIYDYKNYDSFFSDAFSSGLSGNSGWEHSYTMSSNMFGCLMKNDVKLRNKVKSILGRVYMKNLNLSLNDTSSKNLRTIQIIYDIFRQFHDYRPLMIIRIIWEFLLVSFQRYVSEKHDNEIILNLIDYLIDSEVDSNVGAKGLEIERLQFVSVNVKPCTYPLLCRFFEKCQSYRYSSLEQFFFILGKIDYNFASFIVNYFPDKTKLEYNAYISKIDSATTLEFLLNKNKILMNRSNFIHLINRFLSFDRMDIFDQFYQTNQQEMDNILVNNCNVKNFFRFLPNVELPSKDYLTLIEPYTKRFNWIQIKKFE